MRTSPAGINLICEYEGCKLAAYRDSAGIWTIGYGHTSDVHFGDTCTQAQARAWLTADLSVAETAVNRLVTVAITQSRFDALVSFTYNLGQGSLAQSSLLRYTNARQWQQAATSFGLWNNARVNGKLVPVDGLTRRRAAEAALYMTPDPPAPVIVPPAKLTEVTPASPWWSRFLPR